jgi:hypothetical protein
VEEHYVRFEVFVAVKIEIIWLMMLYSVALGYQLFGAPCCLHLQDEASCDGKKKDIYRIGVQEDGRFCQPV